MLNLLTISALWHHLKRLTRVVIVVSGVFALLIGLGIVLLRYWVLPDIERYHAKIADSLSQAIGSEVAIGKIEADWRGLNPHLVLSEVQLLDDQNRPALVLPRVEGSVSWLSLPLAELRLKNLDIAQPQLLLLRNRQGRIFVGGIALREAAGDKSFANWILHQSHVIVRGARVVWADETRDAPPLVLDNLNLRIENGLFARHRFGLHASLPAELASPLDIRGDFRGKSFDNLADWDGRIFAQLNYTDVTAWRPWVELPAELSRGKGGIRGWFDIRSGKLAGMSADVDLRQLLTRLSSELPEMAVDQLRGRVSWNSAPGETTFAIQKLSMQLHNGLNLPPTDFSVHLVRDKAGKIVSGDIGSGRMQLQSVLALTPYVPMTPEWRSQLEQYRPAGTVEQMDLSWDGVPGKLNRYRIKGAVSDFSSAAVGEIPGLSGFSATIDGDEEGGQIRLESRQLTFDAPAALREPVTLDTLTGQLGWQPKGKEWQLAFDNVAFANADAAGTLYGSYATQVGTPGQIDLNLALTRGEVSSAARYTPFIALAPKDNEWLAGALQAGQTSDFRLRIKGNLNDFPLKENSSAILELGGHASGVVLEFDKHWPKIENIDGEFWIRGRRLELRSESASVMGGEIRKVTAEVGDLTAAEMSLAISGEVVAPSERFLDFIQKSPVRDYINRFTDGMHARGDGALKLSMQIPLLGAQPFRLNGEFSADKNDLDFGKGIPPLRNTRGKLLFTERSAQADSVTTEILGGNAGLSFKSDAAGLQIVAQGRADFDALRRREPSWLLNRLHGNTRWDASLRMSETSRRLKITSDLSGVRSTLPGAFGKTAQSKMPLLIEMPDSSNGQESIHVRLDKLGSAEITPQGQSWKMLATFKNPTLTGTIERKPEGQGGWRANLDSLNWPEETASTGGASTASATLAPSELPAMEIQVDQLNWAGKQLGRLIFVGVPENGGWRLGRLAIENPDGSLNGKGFWKGDADASETQLTLKLNISNAGKILARSGYPDTVKDGSGQLDAELHWNGAPNTFNYATLDGALKLDTGKGQFLKMKPGIGKLLGILSLQSIPKRITLDFNDVFSDGFQFDSIRGSAKIDNGVMRTDDLKLEGSSAKVTMKGSVDMNRETQNLRVKILPTVGDSVSLIGAFAAGPAIGVGALLVNKVLGEPLDKLVSFEYNVSGTWSDPIVAKVGQGSANPSANKPE